MAVVFQSLGRVQLCNPVDCSTPGFSVKVKVTQSCPTLCDPMGKAVHWILQGRRLEWVAFSFSRGSSQPRDWTQVSHIAGGFFTSWATREAQGGGGLIAKPSNSCDLIDCSPPGSSVHGIFQARILECIAICCSRGSSRPRPPALQADSLPIEPLFQNDRKNRTVLFNRHIFYPSFRWCWCKQTAGSSLRNPEA